MNVSTEEINPINNPPSNQNCINCVDMTDFINNLKEKIADATYRKKLKLLTIAPKSWTQEKIAKEFNVTLHAVRKSQALRKELGILPKIPAKKGKVLSNETIDLVKAFYEDDEYSRMCPGAKEYKSVKINNIKVRKQKLLLLLNIKELYEEFKKKHPSVKIGLSKFFDLRPKWVVTAADSGTSNVCVCEIHQNVKLMTSALPTKIEYKELICKIVCSIDDRQCMMKQCEKYPSTKHLEEYLNFIFTDETEYDDEEKIITYKTWSDSSSKYKQLLEIKEPVEEFIEKVCNLVDELTKHHFISKSQAKYLKDLKENLTSSEAIVLLDFAENYSFVCQDAVQGFHWNNDQATLHPFVVYTRNHQDVLVPSNICVISNERDHGAGTVHTFLKTVVNHVKETVPNLRKIHYFSDGAGSQYKNCKNILNLSYHQEDFQLAAEWNFFATSHGKSPCDGIGMKQSFIRLCYAVC